MSKEELFELTKIDPWWLAQMEELHQTGAMALGWHGGYGWCQLSLIV
jgi:hypothetical protein